MIKITTRAEYYAAQGLSGSTISRPDDPVDDEFIVHCEQLKQYAQGFIDSCKTDNNCIEQHRENKAGQQIILYDTFKKDMTSDYTPEQLKELSGRLKEFANAADVLWNNER